MLQQHRRGQNVDQVWRSSGEERLLSACPLSWIRVMPCHGVGELMIRASDPEQTGSHVRCMPWEPIQHARKPGILYMLFIIRKYEPGIMHASILIKLTSHQKSLLLKGASITSNDPHHATGSPNPSETSLHVKGPTSH